MSYSEYADEKLVSLLKKGDQAAFVEIYERYWTFLYVAALKLTKDEAISMDIAQDIYADFLTNPMRLNTQVSLKAYLYTTVRNKIIDASKHEKVKERYLDSLTAFSQNYVDSTDEQAIYNELVRSLEDILDSLPPQMQRIFRMSRDEGQSHAEIAAALGVTTHTVKKTINRVLHILRARLFQLLIVSIAAQSNTPSFCDPSSAFFRSGDEVLPARQD